MEKMAGIEVVQAVEMQEESAVGVAHLKDQSLAEVAKAEEKQELCVVDQ
jgi:hypothetical protein